MCFNSSSLAVSYVIVVVATVGMSVSLNVRPSHADRVSKLRKQKCKIDFRPLGRRIS